MESEKKELSEEEKAKIEAARRRMELVVRFRNGEELTKEEVCEAMGFDINDLPKFKNGKRNFRVRRMLGLLTKDEHSKYMKDQAKRHKMDRGLEKIYNLIDRGLTPKEA